MLYYRFKYFWPKKLLRIDALLFNCGGYDIYIFLIDKNCQTWYSRPIILLYLSIEHRERPVQCASLGLSSPTLVVSAGY